MKVEYNEPSEEAKQLIEKFNKRVDNLFDETLNNGGSLAYMDEEGWLIHEDAKQGKKRIKFLKGK